MTFGFPILFYSIPLVGLLLVLFIYFYLKKQNKLLKKIVTTYKNNSPLLYFSPLKKNIKYALLILASLALLATLARPFYGTTLVEQKSKGIDILFAIDTSKSMLAQDIKPNRLERSKYAVLDLLQHLQGDRVGLVAFSGNAFLQCPLTLDYNAFRLSLEALDTQTIQKGSTNIAQALMTAELSFREESNYKFVILITDGEDLAKGSLEAAKYLAKKGITVFTVGVGTSDGELIPIKLENGSIDYLKDASGKIVKTKLDEKTLKTIASITKGFYVPLGTGEGLMKIYDSTLSLLPKAEISSTFKKVPTERYQIPLALAIALLLIEPLISTRKRPKGAA